MPLVARLMLTLWLGFLVFIILRLQSGEETSPFRFVSWNEFIHDMLSKGEVELYFKSSCLLLIVYIHILCAFPRTWIMEFIESSHPIHH